MNSNKLSREGIDNGGMGEWRSPSLMLNDLTELESSALLHCDKNQQRILNFSMPPWRNNSHHPPQMNSRPPGSSFES